MRAMKRHNHFACRTFGRTRQVSLFVLLLFSISLLILAGCTNPQSQSTQTSTEDVLSYLNEKVPADIHEGFARGFIVQIERSVPVHSFVGNKTAAAADRQLTSINGFTAHMTPDELSALLADPNVRWIAPDRKVRSAKTTDDGVYSSGLLRATTGTDEVQQAISSDTFTGMTGKDIGIAFIDSGIYKDHVDWKNGVTRQEVFLKPSKDYINVDKYGHGTHVAGLAVGSGKDSYENGYDLRIGGIAPNAKAYDLVVLDGQGGGSVSNVIKAIEWAITNKQKEGIRIINLSLGVPPMSSHETDPLAQACASAVQAGLVVVASAGNFGDFEGRTLYGGITSPAYSPYVIAVGAAQTQDTVTRSDDTVADFSSRGPTLFDGLPKPDLIAPGTNLKAPVSKDSLIQTTFPELLVDPCLEGANGCGQLRDNPQYLQMSGTSMAAPVVAGTIALMLEENPSLTPNAVKAILMATAQTLPDEPYIHQGAGLLNTEGAVRLAGSISDLDGLDIGDEWTFDDVTPVSRIGDEQVVWGQGIGWTGFTLEGIGVWGIFQAGYSADTVWGQGIGWTGILEFFFDPVYESPVSDLWTNSLVDPMSLPLASLEVPITQGIGWTGLIPIFINPLHPAFPQN